MHRKQDQTQNSFGRGMILGAWLSIAGLLYLVFDYWEDGRLNPNRKPESVLLSDGRTEIVLERNTHNHYVASGSINGHLVTFLLDTGATDVVVPMSLADKLGLTRGRQGIAATANGTITVYRTLIESLSLGDIEFRDVRASLNPNMATEEVLLGMSALGEVELLQQGNFLRVRGVGSQD